MGDKAYEDWRDAHRRAQWNAETDASINHRADEAQNNEWMRNYKANREKHDLEMAEEIKKYKTSERTKAGYYDYDEDGDRVMSKAERLAWRQANPNKGGKSRRKKSRRHKSRRRNSKRR